jgi:rubrerythrin
VATSLADPLPAGRAHRGPLSRFRCSDCGYGDSCRIAPERCPMCGGSVWEFEQWRLFTQFLSDLDYR